MGLYVPAKQIPLTASVTGPGFVERERHIQPLEEQDEKPAWTQGPGPWRTLVRWV